MPIYEYEHIGGSCAKGHVIEAKQSVNDTPLTTCPYCHGSVQKIMSLNFVNTPKTNTELRDSGFTKLVKRDDGVYENVTRRNGDQRYMIRNRPETIPDISKTITD